MNTLQELQDWLIGKGFRIYNNGLASRDNECKWYACKRYESQFVCETNYDKEGIQIVIWPYEWTINGRHCQSVEVDLTGEANDVWYKLQAYSLTWKELPEKMDKIVEALVKAWESIPREALEEDNE